MAYTATLVKHNVAGDQRILTYSITADAASGSFGTPLGFIDGFSIGPVSMATASPKIRVNTNGTSGAANGSMFISSAANGDNFFMIVYGRS